MEPQFHSGNEQMKDEICRLLRIHNEVDATNIQLDVTEGEVSLLGSVPEPEMRRTVEYLVAQSPGVKRVMNYLLIKHNETIFP